MGSFAGHLIPGVFFVSFALWWTVHIWLRYWKARLRSDIKSYKNSATYTCGSCCCQNRSLPIEGFLKITFTVIGIIAEIATGFNGYGYFANIGNAQHISMYSMFLISGVIDILLYFGISLPKNLDYYWASVAFMGEGILFKFHLHERSELDVQIHTLLIYVIFSCAVVVLLELYWQDSFLAGFSRAFLVMLQGTWFIQLGFILYNPIPGGSPWTSDHHSLTISTVVFTWHAMGIFIIMLTIGGIIKCFTTTGVKTSYKGRTGDRLAMQRLLQDETDTPNGHTILNMQDYESETEFQTNG